MSDLKDQLFGKVSSDIDPFKKILGYIPGFKGYIERQKRRDADKLLRDTIADRIEEMWARVSTLQRDFISRGEIALVDDLEAAAVKLRTFADRIRRAPRGYSSLFEAVKVNEDELAQLYQYDASMLELSDSVGRAIDNIESSIGTDGLAAAIRNLITITQQCIDVYNRRDEAVTGGSTE
ncbi:MAG: hypothetical protein GYA34_12115 [Chloroflexi bacterium]|nr:hypothetical protein [Chloroflexota bacterium]